jgi:hypothetical protein
VLGSLDPLFYTPPFEPTTGLWQPLPPALLAAILTTALAQGAQLATRNVSGFTGLGLDLINPWDQR